MTCVLFLRRFGALFFMGAFLWGACCWGQPSGPDADRIVTRIAQIELSRDGKYMALAIRRLQNGNGLGQDIQIWSLETGKMLWTAEGPGKNMEILRFSPDSSKVALSGVVVGDGDVSAKVWDTASGKQEMELVLERFEYVQSMVFSPDSKTLLATIYSINMLVEKAEIKLFNVETGKAEQSLIASDGSIYHLICSADGSTLVAVLFSAVTSTLRNVEVVFWNTLDYSIKQRVSMGNITINQFALSPDATRAALLGAKFDPKEMRYILTLWDIENQSFQPLPFPDANKERLINIAFNPAGNRLIVHSEVFKPGQAEVWILSAATGDVLGQLNADNIFGDKKYPGSRTAFTPDGKAIAIVENGTKRVDFLSLEDGSFIRAIE